MMEIGEIEYWSDGVMGLSPPHYSNTPPLPVEVLPYFITSSLLD
jgi:hypothetical protein